MIYSIVAVAGQPKRFVYFETKEDFDADTLGGNRTYKFLEKDYPYIQRYLEAYQNDRIDQNIDIYNVENELTRDDYQDVMRLVGLEVDTTSGQYIYPTGVDPLTAYQAAFTSSNGDNRSDVSTYFKDKAKPANWFRDWPYNFGPDWNGVIPMKTRKARTMTEAKEAGWSSVMSDEKLDPSWADTIIEDIDLQKLNDVIDDYEANRPSDKNFADQYKEALDGMPPGFEPVWRGGKNGGFEPVRISNLYPTQAEAEQNRKSGEQLRQNEDGTWSNIAGSDKADLRPPAQFLHPRDAEASAQQMTQMTGIPHRVAINNGWYTVERTPAPDPEPRRSLSQTIDDLIMGGSYDEAFALDRVRDQIEGRGPKSGRLGFSDAVKIASENAGGSASKFQEIFDSIAEFSLDTAFGASTEQGPGPSQPITNPFEIGGPQTQGFPPNFTDSPAFRDSPDFAPSFAGKYGPPSQFGDPNAEIRGTDKNPLGQIYSDAYITKYNDEIASGSDPDEAEKEASEAARDAQKAWQAANPNAREQYESAIDNGMDPLTAALQFGFAGPNARELAYGSTLRARLWRAQQAGAVRRGFTDPLEAQAAPGGRDGVPTFELEPLGDSEMGYWDVSMLDPRQKSDFFQNVPNDDDLLRRQNPHDYIPAGATNITRNSNNNIATYTDPITGERKQVDLDRVETGQYFRSDKYFKDSFGLRPDEVNKYRTQAQERRDFGISQREQNQKAATGASEFAKSMVAPRPPVALGKKRFRVTT
jgi:hypothetical protein|tara:strand:- start:5094 stop:7358 length:2265 start_codon:yes stop_codon:yes gene_type:complete